MVVVVDEDAVVELVTDGSGDVVVVPGVVVVVLPQDEKIVVAINKQANTLNSNLCFISSPYS